MMERVLGPLPKHMIVRAEYVYKSLSIPVMWFFIILVDVHLVEADTLFP
jgi:hypothetical protein